MKKINSIIRYLGGTARFKGYRYVIDAIELSLMIGDEPFQITKDIYPALAQKYETTEFNIEHNIRTLVRYCYRTNQDRMCRLAGYPLMQPPTNREFIDILSYAVQLERGHRTSKVI